jgi:hypothetical protein
MVELAEIQTIYYVIAAIGSVGTLLTAIIGVRSYLNANKRAEDTKKKEQATQELALKAQQQNLETRQTQVFMNIFERFNNPDLMNAWNNITMEMKYRDYDEFLEKYGWEKNPSYFIHFDRIGWTLHGMGVLLRKNQIDPELVCDLCGAGILDFWDKAKPFYVEWRRRYNIPVYEGIDYLYDRVKVIFNEKHPEKLVSQ